MKHRVRECKGIVKQELDTRRNAKDMRLRHWASIMWKGKESGQSIRALCRDTMIKYVFDPGYTLNQGKD